MRPCIGSLRHLVIRVGLGLAALSLGPTLAAADTTQVAEATAIVDACSGAEASLRSSRDLAANPGAPYRTALYTGEAYVAQAYRLSLLTPWPADLTTLRTRLDNSLLVTIGKLAALDRPTRTWTTADIRTVLDKEITRMHRAVVLLQGVAPPAAAVAAPAPVVAPVVTPAPAPVTISTSIQDMVPGTGFTAATAQPSAIGSGPGADATAIARWDVVPYQTFTGKLPIGIVAFHISGIDRVEFFLNGGPATVVNAMTKNPVSNQWEYSAYADASTVQDGQIEVRAVVYPVRGIPRVLAGDHTGSLDNMVHGQYSLFLSANSHGSLPTNVRYVATTGSDATGNGTAANPFQTPQRAVEDIRDTPTPYAGAGDGGVVYMGAGDYALPDLGYTANTASRWFTLAGAANVSRDAVRIVSVTNGGNGHGLNMKFVHLEHLTIQGELTIPSGSPEMNPTVWANDIVVDGGGKQIYPEPFYPYGSWNRGVWITNSAYRNVGRGIHGVTLARGITLDDIGQTGIYNVNGLVADVVIHRIQPIVNGVHPDTIQWNGGPGGAVDNAIMYGVRAYDAGRLDFGVQGLFIRMSVGSVKPQNIAIVNCELHVAGNSQLIHDVDHLLIWNCDFLPNAGVGGALLLNNDVDQTVTLHNFSLRNSVINFLSNHATNEPANNDPSWADRNHFIASSDLPGTNVTSGGTEATLFSDPTNLNYTPAVGSVLLGRIPTPLVGGDAAGQLRTTPDAVGAYGASH